MMNQMSKLSPFSLVELKEKLKRRSDMHWARKVWHMGGVSIIAYIYSQVTQPVALLLLTLVWLVFVPFDILRLRYPALNEVALTVCKPIMRQNEVNKLAGTSYLITGTLLVALIFPPPVVLLTLLFLAFADPIASFFGIRFGKDKIFGAKSLQGFLGAYFVCAILTFLFLTNHWVLMDHLVIVSLLGGLIGALAELIPIWKLDDNFTLPILSAIGLWVTFTLFGAFSAYGAL